MNKKVLEMKLRRMKTILGLVLTLTLMFSLSISVCASSANRNEEDYAIRKVNATSIMIGTDKGFEGEKELTRAEAITIIVRMKGLNEDTIKEFRTKDGEELVFKDVPKDHWANPYINAAFNLELTEGVGEGLFNPSSPVTVSEVYTMAVRSLNADKLVRAEKKDDEEWYVPYLNFANDHHISDNVNKLFTDVCNRTTCAIIVSNTLNQKPWESSLVTSGNSHRESPEVTFTESQETLLSKLGFLEKEGITITEVDTKDKKIKTSEKVNNKNTFEGASTLNLFGIKRGIKYTLWFDERSSSKDKGKLTGFYEEVSSSDVISFKDIKKIGTNYITVLERDNKESDSGIKDSKDSKEDKELKLNTLMMRDDPSKFGFDLYYNDIKQTDYTKLKENSSLSGYLIKTSDGKISKMYIEEFNYFGVIKELTDKKITFETKNLVKGSITETISLSEDNEVIFTDLKVGDALMFHKERRSDLYSGSSSGGTRYTLKKLESHSGRIKSVSTEARTINGVNLQSVTLLGDYENGIWKLDSRINDYKVSPGDEGTFFFNDSEDIVLFVPYSETFGDYIYVTSTRKLRPKYTDDDYAYEVRVTSMDGKLSDWLELDLEESAPRLLGLKDWTLTEDVCANLSSPIYLHTDSNLSEDQGENTNLVELDSTYWQDHKGQTVYILDKWIFDDFCTYGEKPFYASAPIWDIASNYYVFEKREDAKKAANILIKSYCTYFEENGDRYSLFNGNAFTAKISGSKITLTGLGKIYDEEWMGFEHDNEPRNEIMWISSFTNGKKYDTVTGYIGKTYYLTDDVKVFVASWNGETGYKEELTLKEVDKETLENIPKDDFFPPICSALNTSNIYAFALGADDDEREVSFIIIPEGCISKKTDTELWAVLLETGSSIYDKEECQSDNKNIDSFAEVVFEGTDRVRTLYFEDSKFNGDNKLTAKLAGDEVVLPAVYKFDIEGNEIKKARANNQWDSVKYFSSSDEGDPGLIAEFQGVINKVISDTRVKINDFADYNNPSLNTKAFFDNDPEYFFLSDKVIILSKEEGTSSYKILDSIYDLKETSLDLDTVPTTQEELDRLKAENIEKLEDEAYRFITYNKEGDIVILAIIKE